MAKALSVDDPGWCRCSAERSILEITIDTEKIGAMMYAVDDYLMHVKMCESLLSIKNLITKR
ncbi:MAG: KEOPS complex subunit Pcc1 [Archaeoglobales archaeon]|nr:KEOPS complex subunit Pcc1 [Archaeoglobales archaeon]